MTRQEAIEFGTDRLDLFGGKMEEFIKISLEALREQRPKGHWMKPSEKLPENHESVLTVIQVGKREPKIRSGIFHDNLFSNDNGDVWRATDIEVIAWMPQPIYEVTE